MAKGKVDLSMDDVIATLKRSTLPTVVVEGSDDIVVYRRIEEMFLSKFVSIFPVGGQDKVLRAFERRAEFINNKKIVFVADRDSWVFTGLPNPLIDDLIIFTDGYSIENDAIRDAAVEKLMSRDELSRFGVELSTVSKWFALAMRRYLDGKPEQLDVHPTHLFGVPCLEESVSKMLEDDVEAIELHERIVADPLRFLRGKTLLSLMMRQLSYSGRAAHHQHLAILDAAGAHPGPCISRIFSDVEGALGLV